MDVSELLGRLEEVVNDGLVCRFGQGANRQEKVLEIVDLIRSILPEEIKQAN